MSSVLNFGKYKNKTIDYVFKYDPQYCQWMFSQPLLTENNSEIYNFLKEKLINKNDYYLKFGRYKNKPLSFVIKHDPNYIIWLRGNKYIKNNCDKLYKIVCSINI